MAKMEGKKIVNIPRSPVAVTIINSERMQSALSNVVSLH